jgi:hypothetical protein
MRCEWLEHVSTVNYIPVAEMAFFADAVLTKLYNQEPCKKDVTFDTVTSPTGLACRKIVYQQCGAVICCEVRPNEILVL